MRKRVEALSPIDVKHLKRDIDIIEGRKKAFLVVGLVLLFLFIAALVGTIFLGIAAYNELKSEDYQSAYFLYVMFDSIVGSLAVLLLIGSVAMFVVRGVIFNKQIEKRRRVIEEYEELHAGEE